MFYVLYVYLCIQYVTNYSVKLSMRPYHRQISTMCSTGLTGSCKVGSLASVEELFGSGGPYAAVFRCQRHFKSTAIAWVNDDLPQLTRLRTITIKPSCKPEGIHRSPVSPEGTGHFGITQDLAIWNAPKCFNIKETSRYILKGPNEERAIF